MNLSFSCFSNPRPLVTTCLLTTLFAAGNARGQGIAGPDTGYMGHNTAFGKASGATAPSSRGVKIFGYDISQFQGTVNFSQFSGAASFVVIRASRGAPDPGQTSSQYADSKLSQNRAGAEQNGMEAGFYHYAYPEYNSATAEADCFADNVGSLKTGQFVVLDYESSWTGDRVAWCKTWLDRVQARLGVKPLIYLNLSTARASDWAPVINGAYGLWMARWDYNANADAPTTAWAVTAMRQYSNNERAAGISGAVDGDVFYGSLDQLKAYGYHGGGTPSTIAWSGVPQDGRWYRSDEHLVYHVNGDRPNSVKELIDGNLSQTYDTSDGYIPLSNGSHGWHYYEVAAQNSANGGNDVYTGRWNGGYDPDPPTVTRTGGAEPNTWYTSATSSVSIKCEDALAGIRYFRYKWDEQGTFSDWIRSDNLTSPLQSGKHHLIVEVEDNSFTGTSELGNRATADLGEFWRDTGVPDLQITERVVSTGAQIIVEISITNPNLFSASNVGFDLIQLGTIKSAEGAWTVGDIAPTATIKKTFTFAQTFGTNKSLLFSANYHAGSVKGRLRTRLPKP